jgi:hypothetical protein
LPDLPRATRMATHLIERVIASRTSCALARSFVLFRASVNKLDQKNLHNRHLEANP